MRLIRRFEAVAPGSRGQRHVLAVGKNGETERRSMETECSSTPGRLDFGVGAGQE